MISRVLVADDNASFRRSVREFLALRDDLETCAEAGTGSEAVSQARATNPDIALLDISMPDGNGIEAGRRIKQDCPDTVVIAMSVYQPEMFIGEVVAAGFDGFVSKTAISSDLIPAIEAALFGESWFRLAKNQGTGI